MSSHNIGIQKHLLHLIYNGEQAAADFTVDGKIATKPKPRKMKLESMKLSSHKLPTNNIVRVVAPPEVMKVSHVSKPKYIHTDRCSSLFDHGSQLKYKQKAVATLSFLDGGSLLNFG